MGFWSRGRRDKDDGEVEAPPPAAASIVAATLLAVVEFWTGEQRTLAGMDLSQGRLTDLINREGVLQVVLLHDPPDDPSQLIELRPGMEWTEYPVAEALLVIPPPQTTDPAKRLHRPRQPIDLAIGPFLISGMVHVPAGAQASGFLFRRTARFAPVTRATIRAKGLPDAEQYADVVLVNIGRTEEAGTSGSMSQRR
jgi:hypothetical protein